MAQRGRSPELDGLRGVAIGLVLLGHSTSLYLGEAGYVGVALFYVLSGYLITGILVRGVDLREFFVRRTRRLVPALLAMLVVVVPIAARMHFPGVWRDAALVLLYQGNLLGPASPLMHTWSLAVEEQFYVLWPFAVLLARRWPARRSIIALFALITVSLAARMELFFSGHLDASALSLPCNMAGFAAGALLVVAPPIRRRWFAVVGWAWMLAVALLPLRGSPEGRVLSPVVVLPALVLVLAWTVSGRSRVLAGRPLVWLGGVSYAAYLWNFPVLQMLFRVVGAAVPAELLAPPITLALAWASAKLVEDRFRRPRGEAGEAARPVRARAAA